MKPKDLRRGLEAIDVPGAHEARGRAWELVRPAHAEREPLRREPHRGRLLLALAALAALAAAALSPPGQAVFREVREAIGIEPAAPALFAVPSGGRLLVDSDDGPWIVQPDGSKRLLGDYREASWSPYGRFVVAARQHELAALELDGDVRWTLARRDVRVPRWGGTRLDTRIAYLTQSRLHVVAGDGTGDLDAGGLPAAARVAPAWRPGSGLVLAYADTRGRIHAYEPDRGALRWRSRPLPGVHTLEWSSDGRLLLVLTRDELVTLRAGEPASERPARGIVDAAWRPGSSELAALRREGGESEVVLGSRVLFRGTGSFTGLTWSPDGRWLLIAWQTADQWIFVRATGARKIVAVSNVTRQFGGGRFPAVAGWCCLEPR